MWGKYWSFLCEEDRVEIHGPLIFYLQLTLRDEDRENFSALNVFSYWYVAK